MCKLSHLIEKQGERKRWKERDGRVGSGERQMGEWRERGRVKEGEKRKRREKGEKRNGEKGERQTVCLVNHDEECEVGRETQTQRKRERESWGGGGGGQRGETEREDRKKKKRGESRSKIFGNF